MISRDQAGLLAEKLLVLQKEEHQALHTRIRLRALDKRLQALHSQIHDDDYHLDGTTRPKDNRLPEPEVRALRARLAVSWKARSKIEAEMEGLEQQWEESCANLSDIRAELGSDLLHAFIDLNVIAEMTLRLARDDDLESGFLDYADNGYRLSQEAEIAGFVDRVPIQNWVEALPGDNSEREVPSAQTVENQEAEIASAAFNHGFIEGTEVFLQRWSKCDRRMACGVHWAV